MYQAPDGTLYDDSGQPIPGTGPGGQAPTSWLTAIGINTPDQAGSAPGPQTSTAPVFVPSSPSNPQFVNTAPGATTGANAPALAQVSATNPAIRPDPFSSSGQLTLDQLKAMEAAGGVAPGSPNWNILHPTANAPAPGANAPTPAPSYASPANAPTPDLPTYTPPPAFSYADFTAPDPAKLEQDPSYLYTLRTEQDAIQRSAAARGVLNTGGTIGDLLLNARDVANQGYQNLFSRDLQTYMTNRQNALQTYNTNYQTQYTDPYTFDTGRQQSLYNAQLHNYDLANQYGWYNNLFNFSKDQDAWNRQYQLLQLT